jgi:DNA-binding PadR family transcriptional regulator
MGITERRREFIKALNELCEKYGKPVHYSLVAQKLGVSKWTAYDLLTALKEEGYVECVYTLNEKGGRSTLAFKTTPKGEKLIYEDEKKENLSNVIEEMKEHLKVLNGLSVNEVLQSSMKEISSIKSPLLKALNISAVLFILSQKLAVNWDSISSTYQTLSRSIDPQSGLLGLTALLIGVIVAKIGFNKYNSLISPKINSLLDRYKDLLNELSSRDKEILFDITKDIFRGKILIGEEE